MAAQVDAAPVLIVEVVFSNDRVAKIEVRENDSPRQLAKDFLARFGLPTTLTPMLTAQIEASLCDDEKRRLGWVKQKGMTVAAEKKAKKHTFAEQRAAVERLYSRGRRDESKPAPAPAPPVHTASRSRSSQEASCERLHRTAYDTSRRLDILKQRLQEREVEELKKPYRVSEASRRLAQQQGRGGFAAARKACSQEPKDEPWTCPKCGYSNLGTATACERPVKCGKPLAETCPSAWALSRRIPEGATACATRRPHRAYEPTIVSAKSRQLINEWRGTEQAWDERRRRVPAPVACDEEHCTFKPHINETSKAIAREKRVIELLKEALEDSEDGVHSATERAARAAYDAALAAVDQSQDPAIYDRLYAEASVKRHQAEASAAAPVPLRESVTHQRAVADRLHGELQERRQREEDMRRRAEESARAEREAAIAMRQSRLCAPLLLEDNVHDWLHQEGRVRQERRALRDRAVSAEKDRRACVKLSAASKRVLADKRRRAFEAVFNELVDLCSSDQLTLEELAEPKLPKQKAALACERIEGCSSQLADAAKRAILSAPKDLDLAAFCQVMNHQLDSDVKLPTKRQPPHQSPPEPEPTFRPLLVASAPEPQREGRKIEDILHAYSAMYAARRADLAKSIQAQADQNLTFKPKITRKGHSVCDYPLARKYRDDLSASDLTLFETPRSHNPPAPHPSQPYGDDLLQDEEDDDNFSADDASTLQIYAAACYGVDSPRGS